MKDDMLQAKLADAIRIAENRPQFIGFLTEAEIVEATDFCRRKNNINIKFWGGYEEAKRKVAGFFPGFMIEDDVAELFPLKAITLSFSKKATLSHRDFLGAFMALGIERSSIGDILIEEGRCIAFFREEMWHYFQSNIEKIGKTSVSMQEGYTGDLPINDSFEEISGVIASARLDCLVAFLAKESREKAAGIVKAGFVSVNHREVTSGTKLIAEGDIISIRKKGRFLVDKAGALTAKGRMKISCRKYK